MKVKIWGAYRNDAGGPRRRACFAVWYVPYKNARVGVLGSVCRREESYRIDFLQKSVVGYAQQRVI